jgi:hypothetical protein
MGFNGIKRCGERADIDVAEKCAVKADFFENYFDIYVLRC